MLRNISDMEREELAAIRDQKRRLLGAGAVADKGEDGVGDIYIGDDIHVNEPAPKWPIFWPIVTLLAGLSGLGVAAYLATRPQEVQKPAVNTVKKSGFILDLPGGK